MISIRCVVCGHEKEVTDSHGRRHARSMSDGSRQPAEPDEELTEAYYPDGWRAGVCGTHTDDEVRAAWVLTERLLRREPA